MATLNEVRSRIQGIRSTQKITRAMKIVAATKLRKSDRNQRALKPFAQEIAAILQEVSLYDRLPPDPLLVPKKQVKRVGFLIVSSDRGLCGALNSNLFRRAHTIFEEESAKGREVVLYLLGIKGARFYSHHKMPVVYQQVRVDKTDPNKVAGDFVEKIVQDFKRDEIQELKLIYNSFKSTGSFGFCLKPFLPVRLEGAVKKDVDFIYEDSYGDVLQIALPLYLQNVLLGAILESRASEEASRMLAMDYATENAKTLISELTLFYNRTRQSVITKEISEIVGGAEALEHA